MNLHDQFVEHINKHRALINKVVFLYADHSEDRNDLRQEIIGQAWRSYKSFRGESKFSTWLYRIAVNIAISFIRQHQRRKAHDLPQPNKVTNPSEEKELLERILRVLNPVEKSVVLLMIDGYKQPEIADILGLTEINTRTKVHRIRKKLKEHGFDQFT